MIYGKKIYLRQIVKEDINILYDLCTTDNVMRYNGGQGFAPSRKSMIESFTHFTNPNKKALAIINKNIELVGYIFFKQSRNTTDVYTIGITIGEEYWGQAYGKDAIRTLIKYLFNKKNAHKIELEVVCENVNAIKSYKDCGFIEEGIKRSKYYLEGKYIDTIIMGLLKSEFKV